LSEADSFLEAKALRVEAALRTIVNTWAGAPPLLVEAMAYSLFAGGKRLRPALAFGACELICGDDAPALPAACAIEMIHTYSLIHDDLPAMDDDDLRRGMPTCHVKFGEATAILAGDTLMTMAFDVLADTGRTDVIREVARASGVNGMAGGQILDLEAEENPVDLAGLQAIHRAKTGALIRCSVRTGAMLGGADAAQLDALTRYGEAIGLAFQIADDVLDIVGVEADIGKPVGSDAKSHKVTYPVLVGIDESRRLANEAIDEAIDALAPFDPTRAASLRALATYIIERDK
jgi:geranylgeranyl diphosphate synthase type II